MNDFTKEVQENMGKRQMKARIRWTLEFDYPIPDGADFETNQFYLEESHCQENLLNYLVSQSEEGVCKLCFMGKVELLKVHSNDNQ